MSQGSFKKQNPSTHPAELQKYAYMADSSLLGKSSFSFSPDKIARGTPAATAGWVGSISSPACCDVNGRNVPQSSVSARYQHDITGGTQRQRQDWPGAPATSGGR
eukprot:scpid64807/ scgid24606/ 